MLPLFVTAAIFALLHLPGLGRLAGGSRPSDKAGLALGLGLLAPGVLHLMRPGSFVAGLPSWSAWPGWPEAAVLALGVAELALALGLLVPRTRQPAGWAAVAVFVAAWPAYVLVALGGDSSAGLSQPPWFHYARIPFQLLYIGWAAWVALGHVPGARLRRLGFATFYDRAQVKHGAYLAARKPALMGGLRGTVLEVGPGTGVNLPFFDPSVTWIGVEPNPHMRRRLMTRARELGIEPQFRGFGPAGLEARDASVDAVVTTLVQCSVPDLEAFVRDVKRVLVPGGKFVFIEHVAAPRGTRTRRWQDLLRPVASFCADGCCPNREIGDAIRAGGFATVELEEFEVPPEVIPSLVAPHIAGVATK